MSRKMKVIAGIGLGVLLLAVGLAGAALAQTGTPTPGGGMMGPGTMPGSMMQGTMQPGMMQTRMAAGTPGPGMMGGTVQPGITGPQAAGTPAPGGMMGPGSMMGQGGMMGGQGMMGTQQFMTGTMQSMTGMMMQHMMQHMQGMMGGQGMMGMGQGMMGPGGMMGQGMMGGGLGAPNASPLSISQVVSATKRYIQNLPNNAGAGLAPLDIMEFSNHFYVAVGDKSGGAFEVLVDRYSGAVSPEPGPNMMWNTKFGMMGGQGMMGQGGMMGGQGMMGQGGMMNGGAMGGMMGGIWTPPSTTPAISEQQARANAQKFLDTKFPGTKLPADLMTFPGYYTLDFEKDGRPVGMMSVNSTTGQVWYHTWHGQFLSEQGMSSVGA